MPIQDNLNGALLISAIDFILSFIIIGGIGVILALFPLLNKLGKKNDDNNLKKPLEHTTPKECVLIPASQTPSPPTQPAVPSSIHHGLSDQQLVVLLTAAACEVLGGAVRVEKFRPLTAKGWNWATQGRHELQSHRLK